ncbi:pseudouridine synthase [Neptunomonas phycophila]|uniref:pseudouridine synthase n=1 Tax=Neptunomonas phycophila TaxID=1572645 RepID=UPI00349F0D8B
MFNLDYLLVMTSKKSRLDRFLSRHLSVKRSDIRLVLAQKRVGVDGVIATDMQQPIDQFSRIELDGKLLQAKQPCYVMMHKPVGVVSATKDDIHKTVLDLLRLEHPEQSWDDVHIVGRLDLNSSGLLLLTNHGDWSRQMMSPAHKVTKVYDVTLGNPVDIDRYREAFKQGMHFAYEDIVTLPAELEQISEYVVRVCLVEGRYHQIKRMFGRFRNPVIKLHRISIGSIHLDRTLLPGQSRLLSDDEVNAITLK